jgi:hypothetical protein
VRSPMGMLTKSAVNAPAKVRGPLVAKLGGGAGGAAGLAGAWPDEGGAAWPSALWAKPCAGISAQNSAAARARRLPCFAHPLPDHPRPRFKFVVQMRRARSSRKPAPSIAVVHPGAQCARAITVSRQARQQGESDRVPCSRCSHWPLRLVLPPTPRASGRAARL